MQCNKKKLLDDLVGAREQRRRYFEVERPRNDQVDNRILVGARLQPQREQSPLTSARIESTQ